jgi:hypothetical protein
MLRPSALFREERRLAAFEAARIGQVSWLVDLVRRTER